MIFECQSQKKSKKTCKGDQNEINKKLKHTINSRIFGNGEKPNLFTQFDFIFRDFCDLIYLPTNCHIFFDKSNLFLIL